MRLRLSVSEMRLSMSMAYTPCLQLLCLQQEYMINPRAEMDSHQMPTTIGTQAGGNAAFLGRCRRAMIDPALAHGRVMSLRIIRRGAVATLPLGVIMFCALLVGMNPRTLAVQPSENSLSLAQAREAFAQARGWLNDFAAPRMQAAESAVALDHASAVCVLLRRHGRVLGVGVDDTGDQLMLRRAIGRAMNDTLADPALQSLAGEIRRDAREGGDDEPSRDAQAEARLEMLRRDLGRTLALELEVAGPRTPIIGASLDALAAKIDPGIDGLAIRRQQAWTLAFPAQLRISNQGGDAHRSLSNLAVGAGVSLAQLGDIANLAETSFYRFPTIDLAQAAADAEPMALLRGERLVDRADMNRDRVQALADGLAQHILRSRWPDPPQGHPRLALGFMGDYVPAADQYQPPTAPPLEQTLCALALVRYAQSPATDPERAKDSAVAARLALRDLAEVVAGEVAPLEDLASCAAMLLVACEMPSCMGDGAIAAMIRDAAVRMQAAFDIQRGFIPQARASDDAQRAGGDAQTRPVSVNARAMIACAWSRMLGAKVDGLSAPPRETIRAAIDAAWEATPEPQRVALLPWIGWAERDYAQAVGEPLAHTDELRRLALALGRARLGADGGAVPPDLLGGMALTGDSSSRSMPTAQTVRPTAWLAGVAGDPRLTPAAEQASAWAGHLASMRFLCQLTMSDVRASLQRNADRARGGLCAAPGDQRQPAAAQALALLAAIETLRNWPNAD